MSNSQGVEVNYCSSNLLSEFDKTLSRQGHFGDYLTYRVSVL